MMICLLISKRNFICGRNLKLLFKKKLRHDVGIAVLSYAIKRGIRSDIVSNKLSIVSPQLLHE